MAFDDSTIAQFVFDRDPALNLPLLVRELDDALERSGAGDRHIKWDCEDLVFVDLHGVRFTLSYTGEQALGLPSSLMISVGPGPHGRDDPRDRRRYEDLCHLIADRLRARFAPRETLWHQVAGPVTADLVDDLFDRLPDFSAAPGAFPLARRSPPAEAVRAFPEVEEEMPVSFVEKALAIKTAKAERARAAMTRLSTATIAPVTPANSQPDLPRAKTGGKQGDLDQIRSALYPAEPETQSQNVRMRLAASTVDVTLMMVYLPMGAAMLTCSLLRGGDVTASSRVMALTCTLLAFSHVAGLDVVLSVL